MFGRSKSLVGLDIGSSAVKAVELKPAGKGFKVTCVRQPADPARQHRRRRHPRRYRRRRCHQAPPRWLEGDDEGRRGVAVRQCRHRQEDLAAVDDGSGACRIDLLGSGAIHSLRHPGRQPGLPDPRSRQRRRQEHDGRAAGRCQERKDCRLHRRHRPGGARRGRHRCRCLRPAERLRGQLRHRGRCRRRAAECRRQRDQHQHPARRSVGLHARHLDRRQCLYRGPAEGAQSAIRAGGRVEAGRRASTA